MSMFVNSIWVSEVFLQFVDMSIIMNASLTRLIKLPQMQTILTGAVLSYCGLLFSQY